ncbi:hypothetical protein ACQEVF_31955 [Nonomuraea polychroma]|uniref:hypothetical protein n=1 Tax=Nonomuraea polychroma TaxID=46176 RepID=UPI003D924D8A
MELVENDLIDRGHAVPVGVREPDHLVDLPDQCVEVALARLPLAAGQYTSLPRDRVLRIFPSSRWIQATLSKRVVNVVLPLVLKGVVPVA